jgi:hypothetical protein
MIDAEIVLRSLIGEPLVTVRRGRPNTIVEVSGDSAVVVTSRSPTGQRVPVAWLQDVLDRLGRGETLSLDPNSGSNSIGYRSSFLGAVLLTLPMIDVSDGSPPIAKLTPNYEAAPDVTAELELRLRMYADLVAGGGPERVAPGLLRSLGIYGGASGIWSDVARTRGIAGADAVTVGVLHTGRHYPDDLADSAALYHYPETRRPPGRDRSEIEATKAAGTLRLPVFVVLEEGSRRSVRKGWVATWDDEAQLFLIEFGVLPARVVRGDAVDSEPFELFESRQEMFRQTRGRPSQQRFKMQVLQRYGARCAFCDSAVREWLHAAHLAGDAESGSNDPRNGLPLCSNHHAAFDRGLVSVDPKDGRIYVRGYAVSELNVVRSDLAHLPAAPAVEALTYRWNLRASDDWLPV